MNKKFSVKVRENSKYNPVERTLFVETTNKYSAEMLVLQSLKGLKRSKELLGGYIQNGKITILKTKEVKESK